MNRSQIQPERCFISSIDAAREYVEYNEYKMDPDGEIYDYIMHLMAYNYDNVSARRASFSDDSFIAGILPGSPEELDALLTATRADVTDKHTALKSTEAEIKTTNLLIKNTGQYLANKDMYRRYLKSKNKAVFRESHRAEITLYEAARKYLKESGYLQKEKNDTQSKSGSRVGKSISIQTDVSNTQGTPKASSGSSSDSGTLYIPSIKQLKERKAELLSRKNAQYEDYSYSRAKYRELQTIHSNVHSILDSGRYDHNQNKSARREQSL